MNEKNVKKVPYHAWQNCAYMVRLARHKCPSLLWLLGALAATAVLLHLTQLFVVPAILGAIEAAVPVGRLIIMIALFTGALMLFSAASAYVSSCTIFKRLEVRLHIGALIQTKSMKMSYPGIENQDIRKKMDKAMMLTNNNAAATEAIWKTMTDLLASMAEFLVCLLLLAAVNPLLIGVALVTTAASFFTGNYLNGWGYRHRDEESDYSRKMNYLSDQSQNYTLAKDIRIFGMHGWLEDVYASTMNLMRRFSARGERVYFWGNVAEVLFTFMRNGIAYWFLIGAVLQGALSPAAFVLYFNAVGAFTSGITGVLSALSALHRQSLDISAVREFLDYPEAFRFEEGAPLVPKVDAAYKIELKDVSFCYPEAQQPTLSRINLTIDAGTSLAIVGLNGAGKTTLIKLVCGFLDPTEGEVLLNGVNIKTYNRRDYYRLFSAVFQDFSLLDVTIAENVAQSATDLDLERVRHCVGQAGLTEKIERLSKGFDTYLGRVYEDGVELSGGEVQRLMLARALYKNAPIIVLDEPTAALDPIAESDIYSRYNSLTGGRTSLYISHRLASTRFCSRVILMADGAIAEEGTHDALLAKGGRYAELFEIQSRYYREGVADHGQA